MRRQRDWSGLNFVVFAIGFAVLLWTWAEASLAPAMIPIGSGVTKLASR